MRGDYSGLDVECQTRIEGGYLVTPASDGSGVLVEDQLGKGWINLRTEAIETMYRDFVEQERVGE